MKYKETSILILLWGLLYFPYIIHGGMLGDDAGLLITPNSTNSLGYWSYQWSMSSQLTMTARPLSAILHGLCNWFFGLHYWAYHFVNLTLFLCSILLFYLSIKQIFSLEVGFLASLLALVYPCASSTVFSSIMMNSNLAALFWSAALYSSTKIFNFKYFVITVLLFLSCISYEAFIPLFILNIASGVIFLKKRLNYKVFLIEAIPSVIAISIFGVYRVFIEQIIFNTHFSRIKIPSFDNTLYKLFLSLDNGIKIALFDSIEISFRALRNIDLLSMPHLTLATVVLSFISYWLYKAIIKLSNKNNSYGDFLFIFYKKRINNFNKIIFWFLPVIFFLGSHLTYVFSYYYPDSSGFENRTLGAIRFTTALAATFIYITLYHLLNQTYRQFAALVLVVFFIFFSMSMIGQREAWITAANFNDSNISKINAAIYKQGIQNNKEITLVAMLPDNFHGQVNKEPILFEAWDLTNLLSLSNPSINIKANVNTPATTVDSVKVTLHRYWQALYPFWLYNYRTEKLYLISSEKNWSDIVNK